MLIVGLGNIGAEYSNTYHNVGFMAVDYLLDMLNKTAKDKGQKSQYLKTFVGGKKVVIAKPQTYMNLSGHAVKELLAYHGIKKSECIVVFDDMDISAGEIRIRLAGSGGTHNGIRNICEMVGLDVPRIRIGIGKPPEGWAVADYVLSNIREHNQQAVEKGIQKAAEALHEYVNGASIERIMCRYSK